MKITQLDTLRLTAEPRLLILRVHTDSGIIGLGETYDSPAAVAQYIHADVAKHLIGADPRDIDRHWHTLYRAPRLALGKSVEIRALSAVDVALWDILGQSLDVPIYRLLGGLSRERIAVYNTCAGYRYSGHERGGYHATAQAGNSQRPYEDLYAFLHHADQLAHSLLAEGYRQMKIWPFDGFAADNHGRSISLEQLKQGLEPFRKIRAAVGDQIEVACELHNLWSLPAAIRIAHAVAEFEPVWVEDPVPMDNPETLLRFRDATQVPVCASETIGTRWGFRDLLAQGAVDITMLDITWTGGLSEAKRIAALAETYHLPVTPHDCVGPITLMAGIHLSLNLPNALIQEVVRAYLHGWYQDLVVELPRIENGYVYAPDKPGLGIELKPDVFQRPDAIIETSRAAA